MNGLQEGARAANAPIGVKDKRDVVHLAVGELLLELYAFLLESGARRVDIVDGDGDVPEAAAGIGIAARIALEVDVVLSAVVMSELEDTCINVDRE